MLPGERLRRPQGHFASQGALRANRSREPLLVLRALQQIHQGLVLAARDHEQALVQQVLTTTEN